NEGNYHAAPAAAKQRRPTPLLSRVAAHELALGEGVGVHRLEELVFGRAGGQIQVCVEGVEFEEVAVCAGGRAGAAVSSLLGVVGSLARAVAERVAGGDVFGETFFGRGDLVDDPVNPSAARGVGVVRNERECLRAIGHA